MFDAEAAPAAMLAAVPAQPSPRPSSAKAWSGCSAAKDRRARELQAGDEQLRAGMEPGRRQARSCAVHSPSPAEAPVPTGVAAVVFSLLPPGCIWVPPARACAGGGCSWSFLVSVPDASQTVILPGGSAGFAFQCHLQSRC